MMETKEESLEAKKLKKLMGSKKSLEAKRLKKRWLAMGVFAALVIFFLSQFFLVLGNRRSPSSLREIAESDVVSTGLEPDLSRIGDLELTQEEIEKKLETLFEYQEDNKMQTQELLQANRQTSEELRKLKSLLLEKLESQESKIAALSFPMKKSATSNSLGVEMACVEIEQTSNRQHITDTIFAGTIVRCEIASGAFVSTGIGTPMGSRKVLLRPISNGWLPAGVRAPLKDAIIICSATANEAEERVYIRGERMTITFPDGYGISTEIVAYVSGEDGAEGIRAPKVDKHAAKALLAGVASGVGELTKAMQSQNPLLNLPKLGKSDANFIINLDTLKQSGLQGSSTAIDKMTDHLLKEKEKNAPFLILNNMREVDLVFLHPCELGEENIKEKMRIKRALEEEQRMKTNASSHS